MRRDPPWHMPAGGAIDGGGVFLGKTGDEQTTGNRGTQSCGAVAAQAAMPAGLQPLANHRKLWDAKLKNQGA